MKNIVKRIDLLKCINSNNECKMYLEKNVLLCTECSKSHNIVDNKLIFTENYFNTDNWDNKSEKFKTLDYGEFLFNKINGPKIKDLPNIYGNNGPCINLGSGENDYENYINVDLGNYKNVDVICNLEKLPFKNNSISLVACNSVFEHLKNPEKVKEEVKRVLKTGGYFYLCIPFMCIRHHEIDFRRWTSYGLKDFLETDFEIIESGACRSPAQSLISYVNAFIDLSIKTKILKKTLFFLWKYLSAPLYLLKVNSSEHTQSMAQTIYIIGKKK
tara:strand:- start:834 stop:1649 length:816 start_codon:yes stop_codon:yes gene_type:complete